MYPSTCQQYLESRLTQQWCRPHGQLVSAGLSLTVWRLHPGVVGAGRNSRRWMHLPLIVSGSSSSVGWKKTPFQTPTRTKQSSGKKKLFFKIKGESSDSIGSLVPVMFVVRANLTDLIQVVLKIPRRVDLHGRKGGKQKKASLSLTWWLV